MIFILEDANMDLIGAVPEIHQLTLFRIGTYLGGHPKFPIKKVREWSYPPKEAI